MHIIQIYNTNYIKKLHTKIQKNITGFKFISNKLTVTVISSSHLSC